MAQEGTYPEGVGVAEAGGYLGVVHDETDCIIHDALLSLENNERASIL